jgi:membrane protease YdiL (CAAX protease family)
VALVYAGNFAPFLAAYLTHTYYCGNWRAIDYLKGWRRAWLGIVAVAFLLLLGQVVIPALLVTRAPAVDLHWSALLHYPVSILCWNSVWGGPVGEEPGWRGYALPRLQSHFGPFRASLLLGVLWAFWHLPLFLLRGWTTTCGVPTFVVVVVGWSLLFTFAVNLSGGSVVVAVFAHAAANAAGPCFERLLAGQPTRQGVSPDLVAGLVLLSLGGLLLALKRRRLDTPGPKDKINHAEELPAEPLA